MQVERTLHGQPARLYAAMPAARAVLQELKHHLGLRMTLLSDPSWRSHRAFGLVRGRLSEVMLAPASWRSYARAIGLGRFHFPRQDILQLGGVALIVNGQQVVWLHRSQTSTDYAPPAEILAQVRRAHTSGETT